LNDFFFGGIKRKLSDYNCESRDDLLNAITEIFTGVNREALWGVFESWVDRLNWLIKHESKHITLRKAQTRDISSRSAEITGGYELMEPLERFRN
jgi:hypothetical protein